MEPMCRMPTISLGWAGARTGTRSSATSSTVTSARDFKAFPPGAASLRSLEYPAETRGCGATARAAPRGQDREAQHVRQHVENERRDRDPARLQQQLKRDGAAEERRAGDGAPRLPAREEHQP